MTVSERAVKSACEIMLDAAPDLVGHWSPGQHPEETDLFKGVGALLDNLQGHPEVWADWMGSPERCGEGITAQPIADSGRPTAKPERLTCAAPAGHATDHSVRTAGGLMIRWASANRT